MNVDIKEFRKSFFSKLPSHTAKKFSIDLDKDFGRKHDVINLTRRVKVDKLVDIDKQDNYFIHDYDRSYVNVFATIIVDNDIVEFGGFDGYYSYGECNGPVKYSFDQAKEIITAINAFIDTANEFKEK